MSNKSAYVKVAERIADKIKTEGLFWRKPWKGGNMERPKNGVSGRPYSGLNSYFLRGLFEDNRWYTAGHMKKEGIKWDGKGELVYGFFCTMRSYKPVRHDENGHEMKWPDFRLKYWYVWNHMQTDLPKREGAAVKDDTVFQPIENAQKVLENYIKREKIKFRHGGNSAYYSPLADTIVLPQPEQFNSSEEYYSTAFHEAGHSTGHSKRLKRDLTNVFGDHKYSFEELVAEMTACYVSHSCDIDCQTTMDNSAAYIQHWSKQLKEAPDKFLKACTQAEKSSEYILHASDVFKDESNVKTIKMKEA